MSAFNSCILGSITFCASMHANEECGANGLPLTPNSIGIYGRFQKLKTIKHKNLCCYIDAILSKHERIFIISEHYEDNLFNRLNGSNSICLDILPISYQILNALSYLHSENIIHSFLSTQNILFTKENSIKLAAYGLYYMTNNGSHISFPIGCPKYMAPEFFFSKFKELKGVEATPILPSAFKSDVWSFGIIILEILLGKFLWSTSSLKHIFVSIMSMRNQPDLHPLDLIISENNFVEQFQKILPDLKELVYKCLNFKPSSRPTVKELLNSNLFIGYTNSNEQNNVLPLNMFSNFSKYQDLKLDVNIALKKDHLDERSLEEVYYLWNLAGGDIIALYRKLDKIKCHPPILNITSFVSNEGEHVGFSNDLSSLFDDSFVFLSLDQLRQRLKEIDPLAYYPIIENRDLNIENVENYSKLPLVIREKDLIYQFHRIILMERLLRAYPYTRSLIVKECRVDIPPLYRPQLWAALLEIQGDVKGRYDTIDKQSFSPTDRQIEVDIPRCHQYNHLLASSTGHEKLKRVLKAWVASHPQYVYWQGLDSLAAPFIYLHFNNEDVAFECLCSFIKKYLHNFFLQDNSAVIREYLIVFSNLIAFHDPIFSNHLNSISFIPDLYAIPWFLTMYAHVFPLHKIFHLWDTLLLGDSSFPLCIGVAILRQLRTQLLTFDFNECILLFSDMPDIDIERCVRDSKKIFDSTPRSCMFRQNAATLPSDVSSFSSIKDEILKTQKNQIPFTPKRHLKIEEVSLEELISDRCIRISAEEMIKISEAKSNTSGRSTKPWILLIDIRSEEEYLKGSLSDSINVPINIALNAQNVFQHQNTLSILDANARTIKVIIGSSRNKDAFKVADSLMKLGYAKICVLHRGIEVLRNEGLLTVAPAQLF